MDPGQKRGIVIMFSLLLVVAVGGYLLSMTAD